MDSEPVQEVAAPSADHQGAGNADDGGHPAARQERYGDAQQPEVQQVEQRACDPAGIPRADRGPDEHVAAGVDLGP